MKLRNLVLSIGLAATPFATLTQQPVIIKFSHVVTVHTPKGMGADYKETDVNPGRWPCYIERHYAELA